MIIIAMAAMMIACSPTNKLRLKVMTFNLKYASAEGDNSWSDRRDLVRQVITSHKPDIIGTQEGLYDQIVDINDDLRGYDWIGLGREGGSYGEFMAIFYRTDRLEPVAYDHYWLSDTPDVIGSITWGHNVRRMVTWVRFRDKQTGTEFYHLNTHFDHQIQAARENSADLIMARIQQMEPPLPTIVTGDFNADQDNIVYRKMTDREGGWLFLLDSWISAKSRSGDGISTFNGWRPPGGTGSRIDWVLHTPEFLCRSTVIDTTSVNGQNPSDHWAVVAELEIK